MLTVSNILSFTRIPLAFVFMLESPVLRFAAVMLAMLTDSIDGYLARRSQSESRFGAILDPLADKFFVYFAVVTLFFEGKLYPWHVLAILSRDLMLIVYGFFMFVMGRWKSIVLRSIRAGKVATAFQFVVLMGITFNFSFSWMTYTTFLVIGVFACIELFQGPEKGVHSWKRG